MSGAVKEAIDNAVPAMPDPAVFIEQCAAMPEPEFLQKSGTLAKAAGIPAGKFRSLVERHRKDAEVAAAAEAKRARATNGHAANDGGDGGDNGGLPPGYYRDGDGHIWFREPDADSDKPRPDVHLCGPLEIVAKTRGTDGANWGTLLTWKDDDGRGHEWAMPQSMLAGDGSDYRRALLDEGLYIAPGKRARDLLTNLLATVGCPARARAVARIGWHDGVFVLPGRTFGGQVDERILLQTEFANDASINQAGMLEEWQENIGRYAAGNSRLALGVSVAFAAPLLHLVAAESGGVHFRGPSSIGKSTGIEVAASVCGGGGLKGYVRQWRLTSNGLEGVAAQHCDLMLALDELSQVDAKDAGAVAYMLANGSGKVRATKTGGGRKPAEWRLLFLSTGEISLADKMAEDGRSRRIMAGQQVRVLDIAADAGAGLGLFETLHGFPSADELARHLRSSAQRYYGTPLVAFLEILVKRPDAIAASVIGVRDDFVTRVSGDGADGQVLRAAARFGLIAAAGELAASLGVLPWPEGEALNAAETCFKAWLEARGTTGPIEIENGIAQVRRFLELHGESRFPWAGDTDSRTAPAINRCGFRKKSLDGDDTEFLVMPEAWRSEVCAGFDAKFIAKAMADRGMLKTQGGRLQVNERLPGMPRTIRVYHVTSGIFAGDEQ